MLNKNGATVFVNSVLRMFPSTKIRDTVQYKMKINNAYTMRCYHVQLNYTQKVKLIDTQYETQ